MGSRRFDLRVRRALAHAIDRETLAQALFAGLSMPADALAVPTNAPAVRAIDSAITKYPYNVRTAMELLQEAGWTLRNQQLVDARGEVFTLDVRTRQGADDESEMAIYASDISKLRSRNAKG